MNTTQPTPANGNTSRYVSTTEASAIIRKSLKKLGWSSRDVSVRSDSFSMGSSIRVVIKNPAVSISKVKEIADEFEKVRHCEYTGEILSGGNRYLDVEYSNDVLNFMAAPLMDALSDDSAEVTFGNYRCMKNDRNSKHDLYYRAWNPSDENDTGMVCWSKEHLARSLVQKMLDRGECWTVSQ